MDTGDNVLEFPMTESVRAINISLMDGSTKLYDCDSLGFVDVVFLAVLKDNKIKAMFNVEKITKIEFSYELPKKKESDVPTNH